MKKEYTHVSLLLDGSGSMNDIIDDVIGGFNAYIEKQKEVPGEMTITLVVFSGTQYKTIYNRVKIAVAEPLTRKNYRPADWTPLIDSAARLIQETGKQLADLSEEERPGKVL